MLEPMFGGIFLAGFECSSQRRWDLKRIDAIDATRHFELCDADYALAKRSGLQTMRDGLRWHLIGAERGRFDWASALPMLRAAKRQNVKVIWDLCHYGYPDRLDIWSDAFVDEISAFAGEAVKVIRRESGERPMICPINEISFWSWLGGGEGEIDPYAIDRSYDLKRQLARASLACIAAVREADPGTLVISAEPLVHVIADSNGEEETREAGAYHNAQFQAVDMLLGKLESELGGHPGTVDMVGLNYYPQNQWRIGGGYVPLGHHDYRPLSDLIVAVWDRYRKPVMIAETGCERSARTVWMAYVCQEVRTAIAAGVPVHGICIYPITNYWGWDNDRLCETGLFHHPDEHGTRNVYLPLLDELRRQENLFRGMHSTGAALLAAE